MMALYVEPKVVRQRWFADPDRDEAVRGVIADESGVVAFVSRVGVAGTRDFDPFDSLSDYVPPMGWEIECQRLHTRHDYSWKPTPYAITLVHGENVYEFPSCIRTALGVFSAEECTVRRLLPAREAQ